MTPIRMAVIKKANDKNGGEMWGKETLLPCWQALFGFNDSERE